jgi:exonuclease SbcC
MQAVELTLKNIRSYRHATLSFPEGITLLSGDIGAGKSTILHAIEFALFGLSRTELSGSALLRHGAREGSVTFVFRIALPGHTPEEYRITRALRRTTNGVVQDNGSIETAAQRETLTPSELRARVFSLLGYPLQFLTKQRNLLYRFTTYTPQEEMKAILSQDSDERLETIRRLFGIDSYRVARDHAQLFAKALRERETIAEQAVQRLQEEEARLTERIARATAVLAGLPALHEERDRLDGQIGMLEGQRTALEAERAGLHALHQAHLMQERGRKILLQELELLERQRTAKERQLADQEAQLARLRTRITEMPARDLEQLAKDETAAVTLLETLHADEGKARAILEQATAPSIGAGTTCPTCKQLVDAEHLAHVTTLAHKQREAATRKLAAIRERIIAARAAHQTARTAIESARARQELMRQEASQALLVTHLVEEYSRLLEHLAPKRATITASAPFDPAKLARMDSLIVEIASLQRTLGDRRQALLSLQSRLGQLTQEELVRVETMARREQVIVERGMLAARLARDTRLRAWLQRQFTPFASTVERHALAAVHQAFDAAYRQWFSRLVEDDALSTRIDHAFAPIMLQHGYETDVAFLSGGERTAVSLAYRLALVRALQVVHAGLAAGCILLDEPTDGFSQEQLERVRDVLHELRVPQIIIVSHEQQLEGFVDHIVRVRKTGDGSLVDVAA